MNCSKCGSPLQPNDKFCQGCGNSAEVSVSRGNATTGWIIETGFIVLILIIFVVIPLIFFVMSAVADPSPSVADISVYVAQLETLEGCTPEQATAFLNLVGTGGGTVLAWVQKIMPDGLTNGDGVPSASWSAYKRYESGGDTNGEILNAYCPVIPNEP